MKFIDRLMFIKKANSRQNKKIITIITLFSFLILSVTIYRNSYNTYLNEVIKKSEDYNYAFISWYDGSDIPERINPARIKAIEELSKIKHIKEVIDVNTKQKSIILAKIQNKEFNKELLLKGKSEEELIKLSNGKYNNKYDIICAKNLYLSDIESNRFIKKNESINMDNFVDKTLITTNKRLFKEEFQTVNLNLIGVFENDEIKINDNYCYASRELILELYDYQKEGAGLEEGWNDLIIEMKDRKYYDEIRTKVNELGYEITLCYSVNNQFFKELERIQKTLIISSIIIITIFIIKINKDEIQEKRKNYGILKSLGISNKEYYKLLLFENILTIFKSLIITLTLALLSTILLKIILSVYPFIFMKYPINIPYNTILYFYFSMIIIVWLTTTYQFNKIKKVSISENIGEHSV